MPDLDLSALTQVVTITDRKGRKWKADPAISAEDALWMISNRGKPVQDIAEEMFQRTIQAVYEALKVYKPDLTKEFVLREFTVDELNAITGYFLALPGQPTPSRAQRRHPKKTPGTAKT